MQFLNKEIEMLTKKRKTPSLIKKQISCGIFQDVENIVRVSSIQKIEE
ncbi:hypothetical protein [Maribacter sp. 2304DJ31-5]